MLAVLAVVLLAGGGLDLILAASTGAAPSTAGQSAAGSAALGGASRVSSWIAEAGNEIDDYAAAMVGDSAESPSQLATSFATLLTNTNDFSLLELTDLSGRVIAASSGDGIDLSGSGWLAGLGATPLVTPITRSGTNLQWFIGRLATTGSFSGALVGALETSQIANLLSPIGPGVPATAEIQVVLPGGILLYSSTMTTTLHAGLTDASMIASGALSERITSPAVTAALTGRSGVDRYTANGVDKIAGYDSVPMPGWVMGVVVSERADAAVPAGAGLTGWSWLLPSLAALLGLALLAGLASTRRPGSFAAVTSRVRFAGFELARLPLLSFRAAAHPPSAGTAEVSALPPSTPGGETTVIHRGSAVPGVRPAARRRLRGRYEILEVTGSGGEGQVLRALDHLHARQVAIKVRRLAPGDLSRRREILNEASVLLRMTPDPHASVVREDFIIGDRYYLVMDWIEGTPLNRLLLERGSPGLPIGAVLDWMGQVAEVLDHLHMQTPVIVHGDVKPSNVIVTSASGGQAILVDFGISQRRERSTDLDVELGAGEAVGSPGYMAPEMSAGAPATPAADTFGLAATTFALLLGHPPRLGEPPDWAKVNPGAVRSFEAAFKVGLAVDPSRRPPSSGAFIAAVRSAAGSSRLVRRPAATRM
jgi:hypothetical protein